jgi:hypothetical protein
MQDSVMIFSHRKFNSYRLVLMWKAVVDITICSVQVHTQVIARMIRRRDLLRMQYIYCKDQKHVLSITSLYLPATGRRERNIAYWHSIENRLYATHSVPISGIEIEYRLLRDNDWRQSS